jgi:hypothetical protein
LYQINATTMIYMNSITLSSEAYGAVGVATGLFVDDTFGRVYACYASPTGGTTMSIFIVNSSTGTQVNSDCSYTPIGTSNPILPLTMHFYDPTSRKLGSISYVPISGSFMGYHVINVASDLCTIPHADLQLARPATTLSGVQYYSPDTLALWISNQEPDIWQQEIVFLVNISSKSGLDNPTSTDTINSAPPFIVGENPPFAGATYGNSSGNLQYASGPMTFTTNYDYAVYISTITPSNGSMIVQYTNPLVNNDTGDYIPKGMVSFPTELTMLAISLDENAISSTSGVIFISTTDGQLKKYRYSDLGGSNPMTVTTPNYNTVTYIDNPPPTISIQTYSKSTHSIYLASSSNNGGIWRIPFYDCSVATTCAICSGLNDPYCGWCSTTSTCSTRTGCSNGIKKLQSSSFFLSTYLRHFF